MAGQKIDLSKIHAALDRIPAEFTGKVAKVGWFESAKYEDGTSVAHVAAIQEFGDGKKIPPRPFMRTTFAEKAEDWVDLGRQALRAVAKGQLSGDQALEVVGMQAVGDIKQKITDIHEPKLSPYTIQQRLNDRKDKTVTASLEKPLIDSAIMFNSITVVVE